MAPRTRKVHVILASSAGRSTQLLAALRSALPELTLSGDRLTVLLCGPGAAPPALLDTLAGLLMHTVGVVALSAAPESTLRCYAGRSALMQAPGFGVGIDYVVQLPDDATMLRGALALAVAVASPGALNLAGVSRAGKASLPLPHIPP